jgi:hypothetical protein
MDYKRQLRVQKWLGLRKINSRENDLEMFEEGQYKKKGY